MWHEIKDFNTFTSPIKSYHFNEKHDDTTAYTQTKTFLFYFFIFLTYSTIQKNAHFGLV